MNKQDLKAIVDELGRVRAQKAQLKDREEELRDIIKNANVPTALGERFEASRVESDRTSVDWKSVAEKFNPSRQLITAHTSVTPVVSIRTKVRRDVQLNESAAS